MISAQKFLNYFYLSKYNINERLKDLMSLFYIKVYLASNLIINLINWWLVYVINNNITQDLVILHYNVDFGANLIGNAKDIFTIPLAGLIIFLFNFILLFVIHHRNIYSYVKSGDKFFANLLLLSSGLANLFLLFSTYSIYLINFKGQ